MPKLSEEVRGNRLKKKAHREGIGRRGYTNTKVKVLPENKRVRLTEG